MWTEDKVQRLVREDEELKKQHNLSTFYVQSIDIGPVIRRHENPHATFKPSCVGILFCCLLLNRCCPFARRTDHVPVPAFEEKHPGKELELARLYSPLCSLSQCTLTHCGQQFQSLRHLRNRSRRKKLLSYNQGKQYQGHQKGRKVLSGPFGFLCRCGCICVSGSKYQ